MTNLQIAKTGDKVWMDDRHGNPSFIATINKETASTVRIGDSWFSRATGKRIGGGWHPSNIVGIVESYVLESGPFQAVAK
jgi:hypothetical protein